MKNRKITVDRPQLSAEEISAGKDFNAVLRNHQLMSKPFYKQTWFFGTAGLASLGLIIGSAFIFDDQVDTESTPIVMNTDAPPADPPEPQLIVMNNAPQPHEEEVFEPQVNHPQITTPIEETTTLESIEPAATEEIEEVTLEERMPDRRPTATSEHGEKPGQELDQSVAELGFFDLNPRIGDKIGGAISREELLDDRGLITKADVEIVHFELHLITGSGSQVFEQEGHLLTPQMREALKGVYKGEEIYFEDIQGKTTSGEVVRLNPLRYTLLN